MVAVLGPFSGGTSVVAGLLHRLGIPMGGAFETPDATNATGNVEAQQLARHCRTFFQEPWLTEQVSFENRRQLLKLWAANHTEHFRSHHRMTGAKHPSLCLMGKEITEAWHHPYLIAVERDYDEVVNSLMRRNWGWPLEACLLITQQLIRSRAVFLASTDCPVIRIAYHEVLKHPSAVITKLCEFLDHEPTSQGIETAKKLVHSR